MNSLNFAVTNHDIQNIVLDNLQFMTGSYTKMNKFDYQDEIIHKLRIFATEKNVHIFLVIHPKKTDEALKVNSIFGTGKASQEADNIFIIQNYKGLRIMEIAKNRFNGNLGKAVLGFDKATCRFFELTEQEFLQYTKGEVTLELLAEKNQEKQNQAKEIELLKIQDIAQKTMLEATKKKEELQKNIETEVEIALEKTKIDQINLDMIALDLKNELIFEANKQSPYTSNVNRVIEGSFSNRVKDDSHITRDTNSGEFFENIETTYNSIKTVKISNLKEDDDETKLKIDHLIVEDLEFTPISQKTKLIKKIPEKDNKNDLKKPKKIIKKIDSIIDNQNSSIPNPTLLGEWHNSMIPHDNEVTSFHTAETKSLTNSITARSSDNKMKFKDNKSTYDKSSIKEMMLKNDLF